MGYKNLKCFEFSMSLLLIFENGSKNNNKIFNVCTLFSKIEKSELENSKHPKNFYPTRFQYEKSKFEDDLIYFLS
jgi:hypothetical protein